MLTQEQFWTKQRNLSASKNDLERKALQGGEAEEDALVACLDEIQRNLGAAAALGLNTSPPGSANTPLGSEEARALLGKPSPRRPDQWVNLRTGEPQPVFSKGQSLAEHYGGKDLSLGRFISGVAMGDARVMKLEAAAMGGNVNSAGGYLISEQVAANVIDAARAQSVMFKSGMVVVPYAGGDSLRIARVSSDPTIAVKAENAAFSEQALTLDGVSLFASTIGCMIVMSRELTADAPNASALIQTTIARALAAEVDRLALAGSGSEEPQGLLLMDGVNTTNVAGAMDYGDLLTGISAVEVANHSPTTIINHPTNSDVLRKLLTNSEANHFATPPPAVSGLQNLMTTACPVANAVVLDGPQMLLGLRQNAQMEVTTDGDTAFSKHQLRVKITWRGSFAIEHANSAWVATGIS